MTTAIILLAVGNATLLGGIYLVYRSGVHFRTVGLRFIAWLSAAVTFIGLLFSLTAPNVLLSALVSVAGGCWHSSLAAWAPGLRTGPSVLSSGRGPNGLSSEKRWRRT